MHGLVHGLIKSTVRLNKSRPAEDQSFCSWTTQRLHCQVSHSPTDQFFLPHQLLALLFKSSTNLVLNSKILNSSR